MRTRILNHCPLCKNKKSRLVCKDARFQYKKCIGCGLVYLQNTPTKSFFRKFYTYSDPEGFNKQIKKVNPLLAIFLNNTILLQLVQTWGEIINNNWEKSVLKLKSRGKILDVGCGPAVLLCRLQKEGWDVSGIEVGDKLVGLASDKVGKKNVYKGELPKIYNKLPGQYDVVTFWHVLEHIDNFRENLSVAKSLLKKSGYLIIEVPHADSSNFKIFGRWWTLLMPPQHLHFWTRRTLHRLLHMQELIIIKVAYPNYFAFIFSSSCVKKYPNLRYLAPFLMVVSFFLSFVSSAVGRGDVIRVYARK